MKNKIHPKVSIIVPTHNSARHLNDCLKSIKNQTYKNIEVVVVDQSSNDGTQDVANKYEAKLISLPKPTFYSPPTTSRNEGARVAKGQILYHLDSDMYLPSDLIAEIVSILQNNPDLGALVVHEKDLTNGFWSKCKSLERKCYWGNDNIESARVVRQRIFEQVEGYDENINTGEDFDIHRRYKDICKIGFCSQTVDHNLGDLSFRRTIVKKYNYGKSAHSYFEKKQESGISILKTELSCYIKNYRLFFANPLIGSGTLILKFSELVAGSLGMLVTKIAWKV